jgi:hypothetical protein
MITITVALFILGGVLELWGVWLLLGEAKRARGALQRWLDLNPNRNEDGSHAQILALNRTIQVLLENQTKPVWAVLLLVTGILVGIAGNVVSLWASPG